MKFSLVLAGLLLSSTCGKARSPGEPPVARFVVGKPEHLYPVGNVAILTNALPVAVTSVVTNGATVLRLALKDGEALWGFGQRYDALNMRGRTMETWILDSWGGGNRSYICAPFFISSAGYGLFVNSTGKVKFDCGAAKADELRIEVPEAGAEVFVFAGTPREIVAEYTKVMGRPREMADWVFEPWISRNSYLSAHDVDRAIDGMEARGLKASAVVLEAWAESLQDFRFEEGRYLKPQEWIEKLHGRGYRVVCWETPSIWDTASTYPIAKSNDWLVLNADGSELRVDWLENAVKIDFRKEAARQWWTKMHEELVAIGVDGFKTDGGERAPDPWFHNLHPYYYQRAALDAFESAGKKGMTFARSGTATCTGNATFWGGDQACTWNDLPRVVRAGLSAALSGFFYWGHDAGGYAGTPTKNLYIRWLQLGALSPIFQLHGTTPREPWVYDDETVRVAKYYFDLRWRLRDYILAAAKQARDDGVPVWRPLLYEFPDDAGTWNLDDEFLLGADLLVAPILSEFDERKVYLPAGEWVNVWTKENVAGPTNLVVRPALAEMPVFARNGAEKFFTALPEAKPAITLAGATDERGIVPTQRILRGQKYEKIFLRAPGEATLEAPEGFEVLPGRTQKGERAAFYVMVPEKLPVGSYSVNAGGQTITLAKLPDWNLTTRDDGYVDLGKQSEATANFILPKAGKARLWLGSGDGMTVWLNGEQVFDWQGHRSAERDEDFVDVDVRAGANTLRVKVTHNRAAIGPNGFYCRLAMD